LRFFDDEDLVVVLVEAVPRVVELGVLRCRERLLEAGFDGVFRDVFAVRDDVDFRDEVVERFVPVERLVVVVARGEVVRVEERGAASPLSGPKIWSHV
jgi:hypothetical protein